MSDDPRNQQNSPKNPADTVAIREDIRVNGSSSERHDGIVPIAAAGDNAEALRAMRRRR